MPFLLVVVVAVVFDFVAVVVFVGLFVAVTVVVVSVAAVVDFVLEPAMLPIKFTHVCAEQAAGNERHFSMADKA